jgi:apolipoprotein N-acyltransferase
LILGYGVYRLSEQQTYPGPRVLVVQPNDPMTRGGSKSVTQEQSLQFHLGATLDALEAEHPDLIVWSETTMPPLNSEARDALRTFASGPFLAQVHAALRGLTNRSGAALIAGGYYVGGWEQTGGKRGSDIRNAAFFYDRTGQQAGRYDKIHLVPFGEFTPFQSSLPALHRFLLRFGPYDQDYTLNPGHGENLTVFTLASRGDPNVTSRFVAPICFDDLDAPLMARMFRGAEHGKRADFIVNLTNDGWFRFPEQQQHLQIAVFRSIENRAPTARAVNTGVSGFIDSCGRVQAVIPPRTTGTLAQDLMLDRRVPLYTRLGDVFAVACMIATGAIVTVGVMQWGRERMRQRAST